MTCMLFTRFFSSFLKQPVEVFCCATADKSFFVSLLLFCHAEPPKGLGSWKDRGGMYTTGTVWKACAVMWLNSYNLRAVTSPDFSSMSLSGNLVPSRTGGIWLLK